MNEEGFRSVVDGGYNGEANGIVQPTFPFVTPKNVSTANFSICSQFQYDLQTDHFRMSNHVAHARILRLR